MVSDIEIIKKIGKKLKIQREQVQFEQLQLDDIHKFFNFFVWGYAFNDEKQAVGLRLENLDIHSSVIDEIRELKHIQKINFRFSQLDEASFLKELKELTHLDLRYCNLKDLSFIKNLSGLTYLDLTGNNLRDLSYLKELKRLSFLDLSDNDISDGFFLKNLNSLIHLNLSKNSEINDYSFLEDLKELRYLHLIWNELKDVSFLENLKQLNSLYLRNNNIKDISFLKYLENLEYIDLAENPVENPPPEVIKQGLRHIKNYMFLFDKSSKEKLKEVKVLFVGDGGSGKTSVMKRLLGEGFDSHESQTHGINIRHWKIKTKEEIKVNFWDFGGQEIMHSTHQFFLSKRGLYILVLDGRKDEKSEYWLKNIESFGIDSPVMVIINKIDQNPGFELNRKFLMDKYPNIKGFFRISCLSGEGINDFTAALKKQVDQIPHIKTTWLNNWFNVKESLENMKEDFISYEKYQEICQNENVSDDESQHKLIELLHDLGVIMHFGEPSLKEMNVINPEWATTGVYNIINSPVLANQKGILRKSQLKDILDKDRFPIRKHDFIIELMKKFELCFSMDEDKILIPDLLAVEEPEFEFDYRGAFKFSLQYDLLPKSIITRFIVLSHLDIKNNLYWRTGVVLQDSLFDCNSVVKSDERDKKIMVFVSGIQAREYFPVIRKTLQNINNSFSKIDAREMVSCCCKECLSDKQPYFHDYEILIKALKKRKKDVMCLKSIEDIPIEDLLSGIGIEKNQDSYSWDVFISHSSMDNDIIYQICKDLDRNKISYWVDKDQINPGDNIRGKILNGLRNSRFFMPCFSKNQLKSGWTTWEFNVAINKWIESHQTEKIFPLIINDLSHEKLQDDIRALKWVKHSNKKDYKKLLNELRN